MTRCELCPGTNKCVPPSGPWKCNHYNFIGEAPGPVENRTGVPFSGKTGDEKNKHYLPLAGLSSSNVWTDNAISCLPVTSEGKLDMKREKDIQLLECCASHHLYPALGEMKPKLIIPMGAFANRAIDKDIDLELHHGIPLKTMWGMTFPMYHPSGGIHEPKKMLLIRNDWIRLGDYIKGNLRKAVDPFRNPDYRLADAAMVEEDLAGCTDLPIACDTESRRDKSPFCLTYSVCPGTGRLIRAEDKAALEVFQYYISQWEAEILWHNWLYDFGVVTKMGLKFPRNRIVDTMVRVFHLGNLPQGLKALAFRELGMKMQDFDDVVTPHSKPLVIDYYRKASLEEWGKPDEELKRDKSGKWKLYKPQGFNTKLKRFFTDWAKDPINKDPFSMWDDNWGGLHEQVEDRMGPYPGKCISHTPFDEALYYACRDSDALLRFWPIAKHRIYRMRKAPQERWAQAA